MKVHNDKMLFYRNLENVLNLCFFSRKDTVEKEIIYCLNSFSFPLSVISVYLLYFFYRRLIKNFTTNELIHWARFIELYEEELCNGTPENPATGVFNRTTEQGKKRWGDLKKRVVEHVSIFLVFSQKRPGILKMLRTC